MLQPGTLAKGLLSFGLQRFRNPHSDSGPGTPLMHYSRFLRFLKLSHAAFPDRKIPQVVAELGPGSSLGFGLACLFSGTQKYFALDLIRQPPSGNILEVFDQMFLLFSNRTPISTEGWCARIFPFAEDLAFPSGILDEETLSQALAPDRIKQLRQNIEEGKEDFVKYIVPWQERPSGVLENPDWIISNAVLEHVDDLDATYRAFAAWSKPGTVMSHMIDFSSHFMATEWNEHWRIGDRLWKMLRGKRAYFINRVPNGDHITQLGTNNFELLAQQRLRRVDGFLKEDFCERFRNISVEDAATHLAFHLSRYRK